MSSRLCLNMIVKDERDIVERCLVAVAPYVDCYVICDTGSTDDTVAIARHTLRRADVPGTIATTSFHDFSHARNVALEMARDSAFDFDYILLCDADMELVVERHDFRDSLDAPAYSVIQRTSDGSLEWGNLRLLDRRVAGCYRGPTHEYLDIVAPATPLQGAWFLDHADGSSRRGKFDRDVQLLTDALAGGHDPARNSFYLANTLFDAGRLAEAAALYERRLSMAGWSEERFYASYRLGRCHELGCRDAEMIERYLLTFDEFAHRAEPIHRLAAHFLGKRQHQLAAHFARLGLGVGLPEEGLFVERDVYTWRLQDVLAVALYWLGDPAQAATLNRGLLHTVPVEERARISRNLKFCEVPR